MSQPPPDAKPSFWKSPLGIAVIIIIAIFALILICCVVIAILAILGPQIGNIFSRITNGTSR